MKISRRRSLRAAILVFILTMVALTVYRMDASDGQGREIERFRASRIGERAAFKDVDKPIPDVEGKRGLSGKTEIDEGTGANISLESPGQDVIFKEPDSPEELVRFVNFSFGKISPYAYTFLKVVDKIYLLEPRNSQWADGVERRVKDGAGELSGIQILSLDCRLSLCRLDYSYPSGGGAGNEFQNYLRGLSGDESFPVLPISYASRFSGDATGFSEGRSYLFSLKPGAAYVVPLEKEVSHRQAESKK